jgi:hypothetical protein
MKEVEVFKSPHPPPTTQTHLNEKKRRRKKKKRIYTRHRIDGGKRTIG